MKRVKLLKQKKGIDITLLILTLILVFIGLVAVTDASAPQALSVYGDKFFLAKQQLIWAAVGTAVFFIVSRIHYTFWEKIATPLFFVSVGLLLFVLLPSFGFKALGARRWIPLGFFSIQPSEIIKLSLAMYLAKVASKNKNPISFFVPLVIVAGIVMFQPDLGTTLVLLGIGICQIFVSGINLLYIAGSAILAGIGTLVVTLLSTYRRERLMTFLETTQDPLGKGYHIRQILLGLGSGGLFGVGLGASRQKYLFLPEASTDSIFAIIAEELGIIGALALIILFGYFIYRCFSVAVHAPDKFSQVLCVGLATWIATQTFLNIGSMVALVPLTGVPLPFISYGGSSLVMILAACGILLNVSKYTHAEK